MAAMISNFYAYPWQLPPTAKAKAKARSSLLRSSSTADSATVLAAAINSNSKNPKRPQNVSGDFYVDERCIDCDVCRWMAPGTFKRIEWKSAVYKQPETADERTAALQALLSCPVKSIHTEKPPSDIKVVHSTFPLPIDEESLPGVYHCGYHSDKSFGGTSYLIQHPDGNILVDSPSFKEKLATQIDALGGVRYMFLTHRDDVADHDKWARRFSCTRIIHTQEVEDHTAEVEKKLEGEGPWRLHPDFTIVYTPGHTQGSVCLFYKPLRVLFTGDHLAATPTGDLSHFEKYNWYSVDKQCTSSRNLLHLDFIWILPGHGRRTRFENVTKKNAAIEKLLSKTMSFQFS